MTARLLLLALTASACARSTTLDDTPDAAREPDARVPVCETGEALPAALAGGFVVVASQCRALDASSPEELQRLGFLWFDACGAATTGIPDGPFSQGTVRREGDAYVYESDGAGSPPGPLAFGVRVLEGEQRGGGPVLHLSSRTSAEPWEAWAVRRLEWEGAPVAAVPQVRACGAVESWSLHEHTGAAAGAVLREGGAAIPRDATQPLAELMASRSFRLVDGRHGSLAGHVVRWTGTTGTASMDGFLGQCAELDGAVELEWDGTRLVTHVEWLVLDADDLDHDGAIDDTLVRRTRTELRADACPRALEAWR